MPPHLLHMRLTPQPHADAVAACVLQAFRALPTKCKPRVNIGGSGRREWGILAGVVLQKRGSGREREPEPTKDDGFDLGQDRGREEDHRDTRKVRPAGRVGDNLTCAALATGMKCLPQSKIAQAKGNVVHDWHAEVLAIRAFNRWLVDECLHLARQGHQNGEHGDHSRWVQWNEIGKHENEKERSVDNGHRSSWRPFTLQSDVDIYMYVSEAPCGDASMELTMAEQDDDTPWSDSSAATAASSSPPTTGEGISLLGRGHFSRLGIVRRKPARPDAPPTLSKSCSDKLALKQCTSLLNSVTSLLLDPRDVYLRTLVVPQDRLVEGAVSRAFGPEGRMEPVRVCEREFEQRGYGVRFFDIAGTTREFEFGRAEGAVPSNLATLCTAAAGMEEEGGTGKMEILINGVLQGRKQFDPRGASCVSRRKIVEAVAEALQVSGSYDGQAAEAFKKVLEGGSYAGLKCSEALEGRSMVKKKVREMALQGWVRNLGDEVWNHDA